jgi:predicted ArsR family transcriptional regulator
LFPDLFDDGPIYPDSPGYKEGDTSREAADSMEERAGTLRRLAFDYIRTHPYHTADEIAEALGETVLAIRPRISELRVKELIVNDGKGQNRSGRPAHKWRAVEK